ncbi:homeobox protein ARX-like [Panicum miliaceum]|uniref:Homeobox protein ARX-like n=1 Tax=Panicum miliaceum TaxID=4540 RepID=A0A3L6RY19_PANMI|nr:homeobox protein ARX-like [Panicum miliaceum]
MQSQSCDLQFRACSMKVKLENPGKQASMAPSRSLPRCASELADPPSPFSSNPAHHPMSLPTTPSGLSSSASYAAKPGAGSPPSTPGKAKSKPTTPAAAMAAYYASQWSPRRLMQRAARAFRSSRSRRVRSKDVTGEERGSSPTSKVSDTACAVNLGGGGAPESELARNDGNGDAAAGAQQQQEKRHDHPDVVPEKIIHEMSHHHAPPVVAEDECGAKTAPAEDECEAKTAPAEEEKDNEKETAAAAAATEEVESPKKAAAPAPAPEPVAAAAEEVADKFVAVVKEAIRKHEEEQGEKKGVARKFQGSRVRTAMEARAESEQPRRREATPRSNDVIEEARSKLLEMRQCSRVRALVGAFETVMDSNKDAAAGTPRQHCRRSAA